MFCDLCNKKEASVFLTQIVNGKMKKMNFCEECSKKKGVNNAAGFSFPDLLFELAMPQEVEEVLDRSSEIICCECGFSQTDFKKTGRLGCSACYRFFTEGILPMLRNMHGSIVHTGKVPAAFAVERDKIIHLQSLQNSLEKAIAEEQYEKAAALRDDIYEFKKKAYPVVKPAPEPMNQKLLPFDNVEAKLPVGKKVASSSTSRVEKK